MKKSGYFYIKLRKIIAKTCVGDTVKIYTIGHSNYSLEKLIRILNKFNINCVVDIRGTPYSKYNTQYNKELLQYSLTKNKFIYLYMAKEFAAKRENKISYNEFGYSDFEKVVLEEDFKNGIKRLKNGCMKGYNIVLLGAMQDPIRCHRSILVGRELVKHGFDVKHILDDLTLKSQLYIDECLLNKYYGSGIQLSLDNNISSYDEIINECYRKANKEIGERVENISKK